MKTSLVTIFLVCLAATGFVGISALTEGRLDENNARVLVTTSAFSFYSLIGLTCVALFSKRASVLGKMGLVFCGAALLHAVYTTWINFDGFESVQNRLALVIVGVAVAHACLMMMINPKNGAVSLLVYIAVGSVVVNTIIAVASVFSLSADSITLMGIIGIIATCATIAAPAVNLVSSK